MAGWEQKLVGAFNNLKTTGGQDNIMKPGRLVSVDPPIVEVCGVQVEKQIHCNPSMINQADLSGLEEAFTATDEALTGVLDALEESKEAAEVKELVEKLGEPLQELQAAIQQIGLAAMALHEKNVVQPGAGVMVRQDGNDLHVMTGTGV